MEYLYRTRTIEITKTLFWEGIQQHAFNGTKQNKTRQDKASPDSDPVHHQDKTTDPVRHQDKTTESKQDMDFIHCQSCFNLKSEASLDFFLSSCKHIVCQVCINEGKTKGYSCPKCKSLKAGLINLSNIKGTNGLAMMLAPNTSPILMSLESALAFQRRHREEYFQYMNQRLNAYKKSTQEFHDRFQEEKRQKEAALREKHSLLAEIHRLKNAVRELQAGRPLNRPHPRENYSSQQNGNYMAGSQPVKQDNPLFVRKTQVPSMSSQNQMRTILPTTTPSKRMCIQRTSTPVTVPPFPFKQSSASGSRLTLSTMTRGSGRSSFPATRISNFFPK